MRRSTGKGNRSTLTITEALSQLLEAAETIELRQSVKPHEENRITSAFYLAGQPECIPKTKTEQRREHYKRLLKKVLTDSGPESVVACALGLGQTAIGNMREAYRLRLPGEIMRKKEKFRSPYVRELVRRFGGNAENHEHSTQELYTDQATYHLPPQNDHISLSTSNFEDMAPSFQRDSEIHASKPEASRLGTSDKAASQPGSLNGRVFALTHEDARAIVISDQIASSVWMTEPYDPGTLPFITISITKRACSHFTTERQQVM